MLSFAFWIKEEFPRQYDELVGILRARKIIFILPDSREFGVVGVDGREYPIPSKEKIAEFIATEIYAAKYEQGFTNLNLVPFALSLSAFAERAGQAIAAHAVSGSIAADTRNPVSISELWSISEKKDRPVYFPQSFEKDFSAEGLTKKEFLNHQIKEKNPCAGWLVELIPASRENDACALPAHIPVCEYLKMLADDSARDNEQFQTLESWMSEFLFALERENRPRDEGIDTALLLGTASCSSEDLSRLSDYCDDCESGECVVATGYWDKEKAQLRAYFANVRYQYGGSARTVVGIMPFSLPKS